RSPELRLRPVVDGILRHEERLKALSDAEIQAQTPKLRAAIAQRTTALVAEVERLKREKHDCPDAGQRAALSDQLARAEAAYGKELQAALDDVLPEAFLCDVTYGTNNEFGFDYLRDNMVFSLEQRVQRVHAYAIIDEVDSILIDEARTPLIISGPVGTESDEKYAQFNAQVVQLVRKQTAVVNDLIAKAEPLLAGEKTTYDGATLLYQAQLGMPKNKKLLKLLQE